MAVNNYQEIERKYWIDSLPFSLEGFMRHSIRQGYISLPQEKTTLRIRQLDDKSILTIKQSMGNYSLIRKEVEMEIKRDDAAPLWEMAQDRLIEKTRYLIPWHQKTIELDLFEGKLQGLILAEIEFSSLEESTDFPIPTWFGRDLTEDWRYTNSQLASQGLP